MIADICLPYGVWSNLILAGVLLFVIYAKRKVFLSAMRRRQGALLQTLDAAYHDLRNGAFSYRPDKGIYDPKKDGWSIYGVLMETGYGDMIVTLYISIDGSVSLYFSSGGGTIGMGEHDNVRILGERVLGKANRIYHYQSLEAVKDGSALPENGQTRFYLQSRSGLLTAVAKEKDLGEGWHELSEFFYSCHDVIGQIRYMEETQDEKINA
jgi:hypothetical protein